MAALRADIDSELRQPFLREFIGFGNSSLQRCGMNSHGVAISPQRMPKVASCLG
jgi:hypothetical protein